MTTTETLVDVPEPGVYRDVAADIYHGWEAASASRLKVLLKRSGLHMLHSISHPAEYDTDAKDLGTAAHCAIWQPELFDAQFCVSSICAATKKDGAACTNEGTIGVDGRWYCGVKGHAPRQEPTETRTVIAASEFTRCAGMRAAIQDHPRARRMIECDGDREISIVWRDRETGVLCKMRADKLAPSESMIFDLKTTRDASPEAFVWAVKKFGYHVSGAMYLDGCAASDMAAEHFGIIAVESAAPHGVKPYIIDDDAIAVGRAEMSKGLRKYAECLESGEWPGYGDDIETISLPDHVLNRFAREQDGGQSW